MQLIVAAGVKEHGPLISLASITWTLQLPSTLAVVGVLSVGSSDIMTAGSMPGCMPRWSSIAILRVVSDSVEQQLYLYNSSDSLFSASKRLQVAKIQTTLLSLLNTLPSNHNGSSTAQAPAVCCPRRSQ